MKLRKGGCHQAMMLFTALVLTVFALGCSTQNASTFNTQTSESASAVSTGSLTNDEQAQPLLPGSGTYAALVVNEAQRVGSLEGAELSEISGISASQHYPGIMYAINDSGNAPKLYALEETGALVESWDIAARNRDWEDMTHIELDGTDYLIIGDTGNNLNRARNSQLLLLPEPSIPAQTTTLTPAITVQFDFIDGPHNVEAFAAVGHQIYMLSKEPVTFSGPAPSKVYRLDLPDDVLTLDENTTLQAQFVATMPPRSLGLQASLAASLAGVDLSHPTAMDYDPVTNSFYVLSYREVLQISKGNNQTWSEAFASKAQRVLSHSLPQAEALTLSEARTLIFTSENVGAPIWAIPLQAPL